MRSVYWAFRFAHYTKNSLRGALVMRGSTVHSLSKITCFVTAYAANLNSNVKPSKFERQQISIGQQNVPHIFIIFSFHQMIMIVFFFFLMKLQHMVIDITSIGLCYFTIALKLTNICFCRKHVETYSFRTARFYVAKMCQFTFYLLPSKSLKLL